MSKRILFIDSLEDTRLKIPRFQGYKLVSETYDNAFDLKRDAREERLAVQLIVTVKKN